MCLTGSFGLLIVSLHDCYYNQNIKMKFKNLTSTTFNVSLSIVVLISKLSFIQDMIQGPFSPTLISQVLIILATFPIIILHERYQQQRKVLSVIRGISLIYMGSFIEEEYYLLVLVLQISNNLKSDLIIDWGILQIQLVSVVALRMMIGMLKWYLLIALFITLSTLIISYIYDALLLQHLMKNCNQQTIHQIISPQSEAEKKISNTLRLSNETNNPHVGLDSEREKPKTPPYFFVTSQGHKEGIYQDGLYFPEQDLIESIGYEMQSIQINRRSWVTNQVALVFDQDLRIIYQTFYLGQLSKSQTDQNNLDKDFTKIFLNTQILVANKDFEDLFQKKNLSNKLYPRKSEHYEQLSFFRVNVDTEITIGDLLRQIKCDQASSFQQQFNLYKLSNKQLDLDFIEIRIIKKNLKGQNLLFLLFDERDVGYIDQDSQRRVAQIMSKGFLEQANNYLNVHLILQMNSEISATDLDSLDQYIIKFRSYVEIVNEYNLLLKNEVHLNVASILLKDMIDAISTQLQDTFEKRNIQLQQVFDVPFYIASINTDSARLRLILHTLLIYTTRFVVDRSLILMVRPFRSNSVIVQIKCSHCNYDDAFVQSLLNAAKRAKMSTKNLNWIQEYGEDIEANVLAYLSLLISGKLQKPFETVISQNSMMINVYVENLVSGEDTQLQAKQYETSLSMLIGGSKNESSRFSCQGQDEGIIPKKFQRDSSSYVYFGAGESSLYGIRRKSISKFSANTPHNKEDRHKGNSLSRIPETNLNQSQADLDEDEESQCPAQPPQLLPHLINKVIKYRVTQNCCAQILILEQEPYLISSLERVFTAWSILTDHALQYSQALDLINKRAENPCRCGNKSYLLYLIDIWIPVIIHQKQNKECFKLTSLIKDLIEKEKIDRGFILGLSNYFDIQTKINCFQNGLDYFLSKPIDLSELYSIINYFKF